MSSFSKPIVVCHGKCKSKCLSCSEEQCNSRKEKHKYVIGEISAIANFY